MNNNIYPCLWFDGKAKEAAEFYCGIFGHSKITADTPMVVQFEIEGKRIMALNGGPMFKITPAISLFVMVESDAAIENMYHQLVAGGTAMMPLDKYPWSERYAWVMDKYGMTWQLMIGNLPAGGQKITANFLFVGEQYGRAKEAMKLYTNIFPNSQIEDEQLYGNGEGQPAGTLKFAQFNLNHETFVAMDGFGPHEFKFSEGLSMVVSCDNQEEIDHYWNTLIEGGGEENRCGWLKDRFGVSWQIVPKILGSLIKDAEKGKRVMQALMKMNKLDIETLQSA